MNADELLARARRLSRGGTRTMRIAAGRDGDRCSFLQLTPVGHPSVRPVGDGDLATYAASELGMLLAGRRPTRGASKVPTIVPAEIVRRVETDNVTLTPVPDKLVLAGEYPVTWLTSLRAGRWESDWIAGLLKVEAEMGAFLLGPRAVASTLSWPDGNDLSRFVSDTLAGASDDGLTALAHGHIETEINEGFRLERTRVRWLTVQLSWTPEVADDWPDLPASKGDLVIQAQNAQSLTGLLRELATPKVRQEARRRQRLQAGAAEHLVGSSRRSP